MSWTLDLARQNFRRMSARSILRYRDFLIRARAGRVAPGRVVRLWMRHPVRGPLWLRERGSDHVTYEEVIENEVYSPVLAAVPGCRQVIDLGANIGLASRYFLAHYPEARVVAVEPDPGSHAVLVRNLSVVPAGRWTAVRAAVWDCSGPVVLSGPGPDHRFDCVRVRDAGPGADREAVSGVTLSDLCARFPHGVIDLVKIDVEGAEVRLFAGDGGWLDRVRAIAIEFHGDSRAASGFDAQMRRHGFAVRDDHPHTVLAVKARPGGADR